MRKSGSLLVMLCMMILLVVGCGSDNGGADKADVVGAEKADKAVVAVVDEDEGYPRLAAKSKMLGRKIEAIRMRAGYLHPVLTDQAAICFPIKKQNLDVKFYIEGSHEYFAEKNGEIVFFGAMTPMGETVLVKHLLTDEALTGNINAFPILGDSIYNVSYVWKLDDGYRVINAIRFDGVPWYNSDVRSVCDVKDIEMMSFIK